jgi:Mn2+/Fe2+ NRAMP family transporter
MGEYVNKQYQNVIGWATSIILIILSAVLLVSGVGVG